MKKAIGLTVNPATGVGGSVGLKGADRVERIEDLYRGREGEDGELMRVPLSLEEG